MGVKVPPPLAVVMPTRNQAAFLAASVASVLADGVALTLIVQDGASTDDTPQLLAALAARHPALSILSQSDSGPAEALNRGFERALATGAPVIGWLNSDDLYTPGALRRALDHLAAHPQHVAVYGEAEHVDADGRVLGRYPTLPPEAPLARWRDACPICQPTMVLRREAVQALLPLDTTLRTAFDFDLWLRLFKAYPGRIGHLGAVQAQSRLHVEGITLRMRERVALEGMQVVHRNLGAAPAHWLVTHVAEALQACPFNAEPAQVQGHLLQLADQAAAWMEPGGAAALKQQMQASRAWQLALPHCVTSVHADGWTGPELELRVLQPAGAHGAVRLLRLHGRHAWPRPGRLRLTLSAWHGGRQVAAHAVWWRQRFVLDLPVHDHRPGARLRFQVRADGSFVPAEVVAGSQDRRRLAFIVESLEAVKAAEGTQTAPAEGAAAMPVADDSHGSRPGP